MKLKAWSPAAPVFASIAAQVDPIALGVAEIGDPVGIGPDRAVRRGG